MNVNTYLPDELGERAKAAGIQFSTLLQGAVTAELKRLDELAAAQDGMVLQQIEVPWISDDDPNKSVNQGELLRFVGKHICGDDPAVYLAKSGEVIVVTPANREGQWSGSYNIHPTVAAFIEDVQDPKSRESDRDDIERLAADPDRKFRELAKHIRKSYQTFDEAVIELGGPRLVELL